MIISPDDSLPNTMDSLRDISKAMSAVHSLRDEAAVNYKITKKKAGRSGGKKRPAGHRR
ncbi:protein of unknown function [Hyphomicrobium sp. MC1]|nr:protein of unknown function [Hyphomicrobium sp. MC1]